MNDPLITAKYRRIEMLFRPDGLSYERQGLREGGVLFRGLSDRTGHELTDLHQSMSHQTRANKAGVVRAIAKFDLGR
jgi:hypothetical protein